MGAIRSRVRAVSDGLAILFDLDGVLLDTEPLYTLATQTVLEPFGKTYDWSVKRHIMGRDERVGARYLVENLELPISPDELLRNRAPILRKLFAQSPAMPGAPEFVAALAARDIPMAVGTSSERELFALKSRDHAWFSHFRAVVCGDDPGVTAKKPAPDIYLLAARALGAVPAQCLVFEDSPAGVQAALAAGMRVVAVPDPAMDHAAYAGAHCIVPSLRDVPGSLLQP